MNYANDEFYDINIADTRVYMKGYTPTLWYLTTVAYYYKGEVFKQTPLFPGIMIGNYGTIYDLRGFKIEPRLSEYGYHTVNVFSAKHGAHKNMFVHRLVMIAHDFIENYEEMEVNHKNGNKIFNYFNPLDREGSNLEWATRQQNARHAYMTGLHAHKYSEDLVRSLLQLMREGYTQKQAAEKLGYDFVKDGIHDLINRVLYNGHFDWISAEFPDVLGAARKTPKYNLPDEVVHVICQMMLARKTIDEIIEYAGLQDRDRRAVQVFLNSLKHNAPGYAHVTTQYFKPGMKLSNLGRSFRNSNGVFDPNYHPSKYPEELLRGILDKLRAGYSRKDAVESLGYTYNQAFSSLISKMMRGGFPNVTKDYPDILARKKPHSIYEFSDEDIHKICQMMVQGAKADDIMVAFNLNYDREKFMNFIRQLRNNIQKRYIHITSQYFK